MGNLLSKTTRLIPKRKNDQKISQLSSGHEENSDSLAPSCDSQNFHLCSLSVHSDPVDSSEASESNKTTSSEASSDFSDEETPSTERVQPTVDLSLDMNPFPLDDVTIKVHLHCYQNGNSPATNLEVLKKNDQGTTYWSPSVSLDELKEILDEDEKKIIVVSILIDNDYFVPHDLILPAFENLFDLVSLWMTSLKIDDHSRRESIFLLKDAPMLRHLSFGSTRPSLSFSTTDNPPLPAKTLSLITSIGFSHDSLNIPCNLDIKDLLRSTRRVLEVWDLPLGHVTLLNPPSFQPQKLLLIKSVDCESTNVSINEKSIQLKHLATLAPYLRLEKLICFEEPTHFKALDDWKSCCESFTIILKLNRSSLKRLEFYPLSNIDDLKFPEEFPALTSLVLRDGIITGKKRNKKTFFPQDFDFHRTFPNVQSIEMIGLSCKLEWLDYFLPSRIFGGSTKNLETIRHLKLWTSWNSHMVSNNFLQDLSKLFPFVKSLEVGKSKAWLEDGLTSIWTYWPNLEELSVQVEWDSENVSFQLNNIDESITGIPGWLCAELKTRSPSPNMEEELKPKKSGIKGMKNLKKFSIVVDVIRQPDSKNEIEPCISLVSAFYGFYSVPKLKVNLRIPHKNGNKEVVRKMFQPIIPFINVDANYDIED